MKSFLLIISSILSTYCNAQSKSDREILLRQVDSLFNELPKTLVDGRHDYKYQRNFEFKCVTKDEIEIIDFRYKPNSSVRVGDYYINRIDLVNLHQNGFFLTQTNDSLYSLQIITSGNKGNIKQEVYNDSSLIMAFEQDRVTVGKWNADYYSTLETLQTSFSELIKLVSPKEVRVQPIQKAKATDFKIVSLPSATNSISQEIDTANPLFNYKSVEIPASFNSSKNFEETNKMVEAYIRDNLDMKGLIPNGVLSGAIIIGDKGRVEEFQSLKRNTIEIEEEASKIINNMPNWSPAQHNNKKVRTSYLLFIMF
jgi:hypothetical protein